MKILHIYSFFLSALMVSEGCNKLVSVPSPSTELDGLTVFRNEATATSTLLAIYIGMEQIDVFRMPQVCGLLSDELELYSNDPFNSQFNKNDIQVTNGTVKTMWDNGFKYIYQANSVIEGVAASASLSIAAKKQLTGEAKFIRAFWNLYLSALYGNIPIVETTDYRINALLANSTRKQVLTRAILDLKEAQQLLSGSYLDALSNVTVEKVRPNKAAATALLARCLLYDEQWSAAVTEASSLIKSGLYRLSGINEIFLKNSTEAIWQIMPVSPAINTLEGNQFISTAQPELGLREGFIRHFEPNDLRRKVWIDSIAVSSQFYYFPFKYKIKNISPGDPMQEYSMVLRLAEQYLIRSEARCHLNDLAGAMQDVNTIRARAGLMPVAPIRDQSQMNIAIDQERRSELFTEWGHRWLDLNRTHRADMVLSLVKPGWRTTDSILPIPQIELQNNPQLAQNPGY